MNKKKRAVFKASICTAAAACFILLCAVLFSAYKLQYPKPASLDSEEERLFLKTAEELHPFSPLTPLFWNKDEAGITENPSVYAASALLADLKTGSILYEKNADILIPPASMTKLIAMYIVFQDAAAHKFSLDDVVPLKAESWAVNAPEGSSLMFLAEGQRVSVRELLLGLAVASGNDAAAAIADFVSGSQSAFVERMNTEMKKLGLRYTRFADASGYSELNATTAREFASFARTYLHLYPEALKEFHSVQTLRYPQSHNSPREKPSPSVVQKNTNPALGIIPGANGLKTGFIPESGYNLSLTVERDNLSILSVTLGGPGQGTVQGNAYRLKDAQSLTDYAYNNFKTASIPDSAQIPVGIIGGKTASFFARETAPCTATVPASASQIRRTFELPDFIYAPVKAGDKIGKAVYSVGNMRIKEIPLIADRSVEKSSRLKKIIDTAAKKLILLLRSGKRAIHQAKTAAH